MANSRTILTAFLGLALSLLAPAAASAQGVHEVRPSGDDEVVIGVDGPTSMEAVVALARRISGNAELTVDDVIANNAHVRYVCRAHGRQIYFGSDPAYGGSRCPEDAVRTRTGVMRGSTYRVPRMHGAVLTPHAPRVTRHASSEETVVVTDEATDAMLADAEARVMSERTRADLLSAELAAMTAARDEARANESAANAEMSAMQAELDSARAEIARLTAEFSTELSAVRAELESVRAELAAALVRTAVEVTLDSRLYGRPIWFWFALVATLLIAMFLFLLWPIRYGFLRPHLAYRETLKEEKDGLKTNLEGEQMAHNVTIKESRQDLAKVRGKLSRAMKSRARWFDRWRDVAEDLESYAQRLTVYQVRKSRIEDTHEKLAKLREMEDAFDAPTVQIELAETMRDEALDRGDAKMAADYDQVIKIFRAQLAKLGFDPDLKTQIRMMATELMDDMLLQCGISFVTRPALELKIEYEERMLEERREAEAKQHLYEALRLLVEEQGNAERADLVKARIALESTFATRSGELEANHWLIAAEKNEAVQEARLNEKTVLKLREENQALRKVAEDARNEAKEVRKLVVALTGEPTEHAKSIMAREARITDLEQQLRDAGIDPGPGPRLSAEFWAAPFSERFTPDPGINGSGTPGMGIVRPRVPTQAITAQRESQLPGPPTSPMSALNGGIYRFLDTLLAFPEDRWIIECNDDAGRDWAYMLNKCQISSPSTGVVELRKFLALVKKRVPEWLSERRRRRTDPPGAPVAT